MSEHLISHDRALYVLSVLGASLFCSFLTLSLAYMVGFIDVIGFKTELIPIVSGLVPGVVLFTFLGVISMGKSHLSRIFAGIVALTVISLLSYIILRIQDYTLTYASYALLSFMISFSAYPVSLIFSYSYNVKSRLSEKSIFALFIGALSVFLILMDAIIYELLGQHTLPQELDLNGSLSFFIALLLLYLSWKNDTAINVT